MKSWQIAALVVVLAIGFYVVTSAPKAQGKDGGSATSNDVFTSLANLAAVGISKIGAPSSASPIAVVPNEGTYDYGVQGKLTRGDVYQSGDQLVDKGSGQALVYGTD